MPRKYKKTTKRRNGRYGRKQYVKKRQNVGTLIADRTKVIMKYAEDLEVNVDGNIGANYLFRCNSIFDPNQSGVGHQPMGHDQYAQFYNNYTVVGAKITVRFVANENGGDVNNQNHITSVGVSTISNVGDTIIQPSEFMENNRASYGLICPQKPIQTFTKYFSSRDFFGVKSPVNEDTLGAPFGHNPSNGAYWQLKFWPGSATGVNRSVSVNVMIQYVCVLTERQAITGS